MRAKAPRLNLPLITRRNSAALLGHLQLAVKVGLNFPGLFVIPCLPLSVFYFRIT